MEEIRFCAPANALHFAQLPAPVVRAWRTSALLERDPETLFHIGEAVGSCQSVTGPYVKDYGRGLLSYLANGHFGILVDADGPDACANMRCTRGAACDGDEKTCSLLRGRAVVRLLLADRGASSGEEAALHLEKFYPGRADTGAA